MPNSTTGPIGQQVGQKIANGSSTNTWPNWPTSTGTASVGAGTTYTGTVSSTSSYQLGLASPTTPKTKVRYVVVKNDNTTLELKEKQSITPQEMIGISKFVSIVSLTAVGTVNITWSELIDSLGIANHFEPGLAADEYSKKNDSEILDIILHDSQ